MAERFWAQNNAAPIQQHQFHVTFGPSWKPYEVKSVTMPQLEVSEGAYRLGNHVYKYPGQQRWNDVTITIVDSGPAISRLKGMLSAQGYDWEGSGAMSKVRHSDTQTVQIRQHRVITTPLDLPTATQKKKGFFAKLGFSKPEKKNGPGFVMAEANINGAVDGLGGFHPEANVWTLKGAWIKSINFGTHDYSSDELISMEIVVAYDYAHIDAQGFSVERVDLEMAKGLPEVEPTRREKRAAKAKADAAEARAAGNDKKAARLEKKAARLGE